MASPKVLHECVPSHHNRSGLVGLQSPHRSQPRLQPSVVRLGPVVRMLVGVVERRRDQLADRSTQRRRQIGDHDVRRSVGRQRPAEEPLRSPNVSTLRDIHDNDLAVLIESPIHVPPHP